MAGDDLRPSTEELADAFDGLEESAASITDDSPASAADDVIDGVQAAAETTEPVAEGEETEPLDEFLTEEAKPVAGEQPRGPDGKFLPKAEDAKPADPAAPATDAPVVAAPVAETKPAEPAPAWEPLSVKVDKELVGIDEAKISRVNGHVFLAIPEKDFPRFQSRIGRGIVGEKTWRALEQERREFDARKAAPAPKSDAEIEAEILAEAMKPFAAEVFTPEQLENITLRVKLAQHDAKQAYAKDEAARMAKASEPAWEEQQTQLLAQSVMDVLQHPDLAGLDPAIVEEIYETEFLHAKNALVFKDESSPTGIASNQLLILNRLKKAKAAVPNSTTNSTTSASVETPKPAPSPTPASAATSVTPAPGAVSPTVKADRFNTGVNTPKPASTSVKGNRTTRPATATTRAPDPAARKPQLTPAMSAEDEYRRETRDWLSSTEL